MRDAIRWFKCKLKPPKNNTDRRMGVILIRNYPDTADAICQIYHAWHMAILITKHFHDFVQKILNTLQDC